MIKPTEEQLIIFLKESNAIEGVYDQESLDQAQKAWYYLIEHDKLTPLVIQRTHAILMILQPIEDKYKGHYRDVGVRIGARYGMNWHNIPKAIEEWCLISNMPDADAIRLHVAYEEIHPFVDGNGRTGRLFMNWTRCVNDLPIITFRASEKHEHYYRLFD